MSGRKLRGESEARAALSAVEASGLSRVAWAHANGVDARSLNAWRLTLRRRGAAAAPLRLVELVASDAASEARYRVRVGTYVVEVDDQFEAEPLRRLLSVVASC